MARLVTTGKHTRRQTEQSRKCPYNITHFINEMNEWGGHGFSHMTTPVCSRRCDRRKSEILKAHLGRRIKYPLLLFDFSLSWILWTDFCKTHQHTRTTIRASRQILFKPTSWNACGIKLWTSKIWGWTDRPEDSNVQCLFMDIDIFQLRENSDEMTWKRYCAYMYIRIGRVVYGSIILEDSRVANLYISIYLPVSFQNVP
jgi:hypothetical protein